VTREKNAENRLRLAVVGAGVAGLTAADALASRHDVVIYESEPVAGGHAHTVRVEDGGRSRSLDIGFIVYNERTYPLFTRLLDRLGVETQPSEMSFSVQCGTCDLAYSGRGVRGLTSRPRQLLRPSYWRLLRDVTRFNRWALGVTDLPAGATLGPAVRAAGLSDELVRHYLLPMTSAIWSSSVADAEQFPLDLFLRFFRNHGLLQVRNQPPWRTVVGGSQRYVEQLATRLGPRLRCRQPVAGVTRETDGVTVTPVNGDAERFDRVVLATHTDQALSLLEDPDARERELLGAIPYRANDLLLHTDRSVLPRSRHAWAAWNYHVPDCRDSSRPLEMTYLLNRLQRFESDRPFCVTLNDGGAVRSDLILRRLRFSHPCYSPAGLQARERLRAENGMRRTYYCGAYLGNGFHEDGVRAGLDVVRAIDPEADWSR
jgi:predicted NAD/FAD-binding protein